MKEDIFLRKVVELGKLWVGNLVKRMEQFTVEITTWVGGNSKTIWLVGFHKAGWK